MDNNIPIVTIHGLKGSVLKDPKDKIVWLSGPQAAGFVTPNLALPITWHNGVQLRDEYVPKHTLRSVTVVPYLVGAIIYGPWLKRAKTLGRPAYEFSYDWRRSHFETITKFEAYLKWISAKHDNVKIQVVAHSMGGLITLAVLNKCPEVFHSVLFAGVPFSGGGILFDLQVGEPTGRNHKILAPSVVYTFPSYYCFFPCLETQKKSKPFIVEKDGTPILIDFFNVEDWKKYQLGIWAHGEVTPEQEEHVKHVLADAEKFRHLIDKANLNIKYPPIAVLISEAHPTLEVVIKDGPQSLCGYDFASAPKAPGDGRVPFENAIPPPGISFKLYKTKKRAYGFSKFEKDPQNFE